MTANRNGTPKYKFLADKVLEAIKELEVLADKEGMVEKCFEIQSANFSHF